MSDKYFVWKVKIFPVALKFLVELRGKRAREKCIEQMIEQGPEYALKHKKVYL